MMLHDDAFLVLNAIYLKKMAAPDAVAEILDLPLDGVRRVVGEAAAEGLALDVGGQIMLDSSGIEAVLGYYRQTYANLAAEPAIVSFYQRFESLNTQFIKLVSDWQMSEGDDRAKERI